MRIALITSHIYKSTQWNWFSEELLKRGIFHIHIIISDKHPVMADELSNLGVKVFVLPHYSRLSLITNLIKIIKILKQEKINLVHTELPYGNLLGQTSAVLTGIKARITTCENASWAIDYNNTKQLLIDKLTYQLSKKIITLTDNSKSYLIEKFNVHPDKIHTIWHAIKIDEYDSVSNDRIEKIKKELNISNEHFVIGMVARGEEWKGHIYAIKAVEILKKEIPNLRLIITGIDNESDYGKKLFDYISKHNIQENVHMIKFIVDNIALYKTFDIHVHVPVDFMVETFGITYIEGMISECAQVITKSGISCFTAKHMVNAYVVNYKSEIEISEGIRLFYNNQELRKKIAFNAKKMAEELFSYDKKVSKHIEIYKALS